MTAKKTPDSYSHGSDPPSTGNKKRMPRTNGMAFAKNSYTNQQITGSGRFMSDAVPELHRLRTWNIPDGSREPNAEVAGELVVATVVRPPADPDWLLSPACMIKIDLTVDNRAELAAGIRRRACARRRQRIHGDGETVRRAQGRYTVVRDHHLHRVGGIRLRNIRTARSNCRYPYQPPHQVGPLNSE